MKKYKRTGVHRLYLTGFIIFGLFLRITLLNVIPPGLANDEANIILNAQSLIKTGKNIPGVVTGIIGTPSGDYISGAHSELSSHFLSVVYFFTGFSLSTSRLPFTIASLGIVIFLYLIEANFISPDSIAEIAGFVKGLILRNHCSETFGSIKP